MRLTVPNFFCALLLSSFVSLAVASAAPAVVGDATLVIGVAHVISGDGSGRLVERGTTVREGDRVETEAGGHVHLRFVDGARVAVRPLSRLLIENYSHSDTQPALNSIRFRLDEGVVRSITGSWGEAARDRFRLNTPVAAIGVKGTDFVVTADLDKTFAAVYTGAIVLSPLSPSCQITLGPCESGFEKSLSESMKGQMIALYRQDASPQIVALVEGLTLNRNRDVVVAMAAADRTDKIVARPSASLSTTVADAAPDKNLIAASSIVKVPDAPAPVVVPPAPTVPTVPTVPVVPVPPVTPPVPVVPDPPAAVVVPPQVKQLAWAAYPWTKLMGGDVLLQTLDAVNAAGRTSVAGNGAYGLYRDPSASNTLVATEATAQFRLAAGSGQLIMAEGRLVEAVRVTGGSLNVDFSRATFDTKLNMSSPTLGADTLAANGLVRPDGVIMSQTGNGSVVGAMSLDGKEAGYSFEKAVSAGTVNGITLWGR